MADLSLYQPHDYLYSSVAACKFCTTLSKIGFHHRSPLENNFYISTMSSDSVNRYWIPHIDIHKRVITQELQYYLGPDATGEFGVSCALDIRKTAFFFPGNSSLISCRRLSEAIYSRSIAVVYEWHTRRLSSLRVKTASSSQHQVLV